MDPLAISHSLCDSVTSPRPPERSVALRLAGLPKRRRRAIVDHYLIDPKHSHIRRHWEAMGSPDSLTPKQVHELKGKDGLQLLRSTDVPVLSSGEVVYRFKLAPSTVSYLVIR